LLSIDVRKNLDKFSLDVSLQVDRGMTVLLGPSGSGKSTLLNLVAGLLEPDAGEIILDGLVYFRSNGKGRPEVLPVHRRQLGYVFQHPALFPHLTVRENILYGLPAGDGRREELAALMELLRLEGLDGRLPEQISGGQAQRVALARALITRPRLLLLDEPFSALDNPIRQKLRWDLLRVLERYPVPSILVTHDFEEAIMLGEQVAVLDEGRILQCAPPAELFFRPGSRKVARFVGMRNIYRGTVRQVLPGNRLEIRGEKFDVVVEHPAVPAGKQVVFGIRPEDVLYLRPEREQKTVENVLEAAVVSVLPQGFMYRLLLQVTDDCYDLEMLLPRHVVKKRGLAPGVRCRVALPGAAVHLISVE
jgi:molybdate transport system ATP-binding protein